jgi:hypothetical protein
MSGAGLTPFRCPELAARYGLGRVFSNNSG